MTEKINVPSINKVIISGRLVGDSDLRYTQDNNSVLTFTIASNKRYKNKNNEWKDNTIFLKIVNWNWNNENLNKRLKKGVPVIIEGSISINKWQDKTGKDRYDFQIRADRIHVLVRNVDSDYESTSSVTYDNIEDKADEMDKDFNNIIDNENNGGTDDIPF